MRLLHFRNAAVHVVRDMEKNHTMAFAAALSYYFVVALFPFLIFLSAVVAYLPVPDFFSQVMGLIARVVPAASMGPLRNLMKGTILSRHRNQAVLPRHWRTSTVHLQATSRTLPAI